MEMREASVLSSTTESTQTSAQTAITEPEPEPKEKIQVLRRTDSVESLQRKVEAIMAATATSTNTKATTKKRNLSHLRNKPLTAPHKLEHPAARSGSPIQDSPDAFADSPILTRRSVSPISKALPSPQRSVRIGLGVKSVNALLKEATKAVKAETANGKKPVISASNAQSKTTVVKKTGISSLRRAAGTATRTRPTATTSVNSARSGLDAIRRMR